MVLFLKVTNNFLITRSKSDQREVSDEVTWKEHAENQLKEFYNSRTKHLDAAPKFESFAPAVDNPVENATLADVLKYIDTSGDSDERRERMRQVFQDYRIQTQVSV